MALALATRCAWQASGAVSVPTGDAGTRRRRQFSPCASIFQEIKLNSFLPVNFLNEDILKSWETCLSYFNCVKTVCAGRERGRGEREKGDVVGSGEEVGEEAEEWEEEESGGRMY